MTPPPKATNRSTRIACDFTGATKFLAAYARLTESNRAAARRAYSLFTKDPNHPSIRFKKLAGYENVWSVRINEQYRAIGERASDTIVWVWIGTHNEFDKLFG